MTARGRPEPGSWPITLLALCLGCLWPKDMQTDGGSIHCCVDIDLERQTLSQPWWVRHSLGNSRDHATETPSTSVPTSDNAIPHMAGSYTRFSS